MHKRVTLQFERRLLEHPAAYHVRRMRLGLWLYLDLLLRLPAGQDTLDVDPVQVAMDMELPEGTIRSWLGHLRRMKYLDAERRQGRISVRIGRLGLPEPPPAPRLRFFTVSVRQSQVGRRDTVTRSRSISKVVQVVGTGVDCRAATQLSGKSSST
jgi:hypothetical protein